MKRIITLTQPTIHYNRIHHIQQKTLTTQTFHNVSQYVTTKLPKPNNLSKFQTTSHLFPINNNFTNNFIKSSKYYRRFGFGFGLTLFGAGLLEHIINPDFKKYQIPTHDGNRKCKREFESQFNPFLRQYYSKPWIWGIIAINIAVFIAWRYGNVEFMQKHFLCSYENIQARRFVIFRHL